MTGPAGGTSHPEPVAACGTPGCGWHGTTEAFPAHDAARHGGGPPIPVLLRRIANQIALDGRDSLARQLFEIADKLDPRRAVAAVVAGSGTPLLTGTPGMERRDDATVDLAAYIDDPEYRAMIDRKAGSGTPGDDR